MVISSADNSMSYRIKLDCEMLGIRAITLINELGYEECSYQLSTGNPIKYLFRGIGGNSSVEFEYSDPKIGFKLDINGTFSIKFKDSFNNFVFTALLCDVKSDVSPIPNLLIPDDNFSQIDENYSSLVEYILDLKYDSNLIELYKKLYDFYSAKSCTLELKGTKNHLVFSNLVYNKIAVFDSKLIEVAQYESCYNGTLHMFANGDSSFETLNHSIKHNNLKSNYTFTGDWNDKEIKSIKNILEFLNTFESKYSKYDKSINELYGKNQ